MMRQKTAVNKNIWVAFCDKGDISRNGWSKKTVAKKPIKVVQERKTRNLLNGIQALNTAIIPTKPIVRYIIVWDSISNIEKCIDNK